MNTKIIVSMIVIISYSSLAIARYEGGSETENDAYNHNHNIQTEKQNGNGNFNYGECMKGNFCFLD